MKKTLGTSVILYMLFTGVAYAQPTDATPSDSAVEAGQPDSRVVVLDPINVAIDPTFPEEVPESGGAAFDKGKQLVELAKAKEWFALSAGIIWLIMFLLKQGRKHIGFMKKMPKRALWIVVPVLSIVAMILTKLQAGLSWGAAVAVLFSGPSVAFMNDFVKRGVMGKEPTTAVNK